MKETVTFQEAVRILENLPAGMLLYELEKKGESYVIPSELLRYLSNSNVFKKRNDEFLIWKSGAITATDIPKVIPTSEIWRIWGIVAQARMDLGVADRVLNVDYTPGARIAMTHNMTWQTTNLTLSGGEDGTILLKEYTGVYNDDGALSQAADYKMPQIAYSGDAINLTSTNKEAGDIMSLDIIYELVGFVI